MIMNKINRKIICSFCASLLLLFFISGCSFPRQKIIDEIQILSVYGFDKVDNHFVGTALYSDYTEVGNKGSTILQGSGKKSLLIKQALNEQSPKPIEVGKLNLLIFGKELAENGVSYFVKAVCRDPLIGSNAILAVSEEPAGELLMKNKAKDSNYIYKLIEQNFRNQFVPLPTFHSFLFDYYGEGRDASIPYIKINQKENIEVNGLVVFKKDKLALILNQKESLLYKLLRGRVIRGQTEFNIQKGQNTDSAILTILNGNEKKLIKTNNGKTKVKFNLTLNGMVKDYPEWLDLMKRKNNLFLNNQLEKQMKEDFEKLLLTFQKHQVDPIGIGDLARAHSKKWNEKEFYEKVYPALDFDVNVKVVLFQSGIGE
ncbi:Ger(x)C family spore germination protein [Gottfriedia acidiceleris]|uniref:Ger(x)C family spore germination protein n=1 Tax=Gottfriedia acidiceleris TaxID=371036 RepID=UPI0014304CA7|nr:Ger(x)C family spore germination protein [Gottfriedia acidiceleris]